MNLKPTSFNVIIQPDEVEKATKSGILLPTAKIKEAPEMGVVLELGPDAREAGIKVGDHVIFGKYDFDIFKHEGIELSIGHVDKVFAVIV